MKYLIAFLVCILLIVGCGSSSAPKAQSKPSVGHHALRTASGGPTAVAVGQRLTTSNGTWTGSPTSYTYQWQSCDGSGNNCSNISNATFPYYDVVSGDASHTIRSIVVAHNSSGVGSSNSLTTVVVASSINGATLQPIDGGSNYYCSNGFTYACDGGWDSASFLPVIQDYSFSNGTNTSTFKSLGLNTTVRVTGGSGGSSSCASGATDLSTLRSAGIFAILGDDSVCNLGSETVGAHIEEPGSWNGSGDANSIAAQTTALSNAYSLTGRFLHVSFTWNQINYGNLSSNVCGASGGNMSMQQVMTCTNSMPGGRRLNIPADDIYWFAGQNTGGSGVPYNCQQIYGLGGLCTTTQITEASHYGDMVDVMRSWMNGGSSTGAPANAPNSPYIESDDGLVGAGAVRITPPQLNWAVWDTIIHGARMITYFSATTNDGCSSNYGFCTSTQSGQSVSIATQATNTNMLAKNLAPIINSPFATGFASGSNSGYTFPTPNTTIGSGNQLDVMTKYYSGTPFSNASGSFGDGFYIFVTGRGAQATTNVPVTITLPSSDTASGSIPEIVASSGSPSTGTVTVSSHQITTTLAHDYDVVIIGPIP